MLVMRLEQDYDSAVAGILVILVLLLAFVNPFSPILQVGPSLGLSPGPVYPYQESFFRLNLFFNSFVIGISAALVLFFRNTSFGIVREIEDGTMAGFVLMPGGRRAVFFSALISGVVIPYLLFCIPVLIEMSVSGASIPAYSALLLALANFMPMLGLAAVVLWSGTVTRSSLNSFGYGASYLILAIATLVAAAGFPGSSVIYLASIFLPPLAADEAMIGSIHATVLHPAILLQQRVDLVPFEMLIAGSFFNIATIYLLYYHWTRKASF